MTEFLDTAADAMAKAPNSKVCAVRCAVCGAVRTALCCAHRPVLPAPLLGALL
jgi:hypothetical protein